MLALPVFAIACGPSAEDTPDGGGSGDGGTSGDGGGGGPGFDYSGGGFGIENITENPADIQSFRVRQGIANDTRVAIWVENRSGDALLDVDLHSGVRTGGAWSDDSLTDDPDVQNSFPSVAMQGSQLALVWNGYPDVDNDVFLSRFDGSTWSTPEDLTSLFEDDPLKQDVRPAVAATPEGGLVVAYFSGDRLEGQTAPLELLLLRIDSGGGVTGPEPVMASDANAVTACGTSQPSLGVASDGTVHVLAACGLGSASTLHYATDAGGAWSEEIFDHPESEEVAAMLTINRDVVHVAWHGNVPCGDSSCGEIYHMRREGSAFGTPTNVTQTPDASEIRPALATDGTDQVVLAYSAVRGEQQDTMFTWLQSTGEFAPAIAVTDGTPGDESPTHIFVDAATGLPILSLEVIASDPFRVDALSATYEAGGTGALP